MAKFRIEEISTISGNSAKALGIFGPYRIRQAARSIHKFAESIVGASKAFKEMNKYIPKES